MSFTKPVINNNFVRVWNRAYRWSGGGREKVLEDGTTATVLVGGISSYNSETKSKDFFDPNMKIAVVGVTSTIGGGVYDNNLGKYTTRFYANEVTNTFDQPLKVFKRTETGSEVLYEAPYASFKNDKPQGMELQVNVYFYNFTTKQIDRFELLGCARNEWFGSKLGNNKALYEQFLHITQGEQRTAGATKFVVPKYDLAERYTDEQRNEIINSEAYKAYAAWEEGLEKNVATSDPSVNQTPAQYDGEGSQEIIDEDSPIDLDDVPF